MQKLGKQIQMYQKISFCNSYSQFRGALFNILNRDDPLSPYYKVCITPPAQPLKNHSGVEIQLGNRIFETTQL